MAEVVTYPCRICGRNFNTESLKKHERVCQKNATKKPRKVFDSGRQRAAGSDIPYNKTLKVQPMRIPSQPPAYSDPGKYGYGSSSRSMQASGIPVAKKSNWRKQHEDFIAAVRAAKAYGQAVKTGGPLPPPAPPSENPDYVQCPTCGRRFNSNAANRHIPFCAERSNRVPSKKVPDANARMRANARKYEPPSPMKPKSGGRGYMGPSSMNSGIGDYGNDSIAQPIRYAGATQTVKRSGLSGATGGSGGRGMSGSYGHRGMPSSGQARGRPGMNGGYADYDARPMGGAPRSEGQFCYECGNQYPSRTAKFCVECGVRRIGF